MNDIRQYIGKVYEIDFAGVRLKLKIIADRRIDPEFGTGALGVTPAHSMLDSVMAEENGLPGIKVIDEDGLIHEGLADYGKKTAKEARQLIVDRLKEKGLFEKEEDIQNNISVCYRCDTPVEPLPSLQWFIDVNKKLGNRQEAIGNRIDWNGKSIKDIAIDVVKSGKIKIIPERFEKTYFNWMENLRDWCISRQIWFGHRIPVWYRTSDELQVSNVELKKEIYVGTEAPEGEGWQQDEDTLDTWFSSGLWTFSTLAHKPEDIRLEDPSTGSGQGGKLIIDTDDFRNFHPTSVLETGYDIIFFWVARMIIMTTYAIGDIPFHDVYLHGLVLDEKGKKMSKSKGNVIDPLIMCEKYGTDATRLSLIVGSTPGNDLRLSEEKIAGFRNFANKLWNVSRYIMQITDNPSTRLRAGRQQITDVDFNNLTLAEHWILVKLNVLIEEVTEDIRNYRFSQAGERLREFTWSDLADWYLEASKFEDSPQKKHILWHILENVLKLWHPFIPFVTEAIWHEMGKENLLMVEQWPASQIADLFDPTQNRRTSQIGEDFEIVKSVVTAIRNARALNNIEPGRKVKAIVYAGGSTDVLRTQADIIKGLRTGIEELEIKEKGDKVEKAIFIAVGKIEIYLLGAIDEEKEKKRLTESIERLKKLITMTESKLADDKFTSRAPEAIVGKERMRLKEFQTEIKKLEEQMRNLS